jgi:hypothetical protein
MMRLLLVLLVGLFVGAGVTGCEEDQSSEAAELGIQEGQRPKGEKRPPPGPDQGGGFEMGDEGQAPGEPSEPGG